MVDAVVVGAGVGAVVVVVEASVVVVAGGLEGGGTKIHPRVSCGANNGRTKNKIFCFLSMLEQDSSI